MFNPILLTLIVFGIWTSYTDLKEGLIKNHSILFLVLVAIFFNIFFTKSFIIHPIVSSTNITMAIVSGIILWLCGMWSAADAKLFAAFTILIPIQLYIAKSYFPGISILINSFVLLFLFSFFPIILKTKLKEKWKNIVELAKPRFILNLLLSMLALNFIFYGISYLFKIPVDYFMIIVIFFIIFWIVEQKFKLKLIYFYTPIIILSFVFFYKLILNLNFFLNFIIS